MVLEKLKDFGVKYITLRSAGYNNVHVKSAMRYNLKVANASNYSPYAIAEHATALLLALNRKIVLADKQVHQYNFLQQDLIGFNIHGKTIGIVGTGNIGTVMAKIMHGFGCKILACDPIQNQSLIELCDIEYVDLEQLCTQSDIISLHIPLNFENYDLINKKRLDLMKKDVLLINTSRGSIVHTEALINVLEENGIGGYGADVYEKEKGIFFKDHSKSGIRDEQLKKLLSFKNVLLTPHQAFATEEALANIAKITFANIDAWQAGQRSANELGWDTEVTIGG